MIVSFSSILCVVRSLLFTSFVLSYSTIASASGAWLNSVFRPLLYHMSSISTYYKRLQNCYPKSKLYIQCLCEKHNIIQEENTDKTIKHMKVQASMECPTMDTINFSNQMGVVFDNNSYIIFPLV